MKAIISPFDNQLFKLLFIVALVGVLMLFANDAFANNVGLAKYQTDTLMPQAKAGWTVLKIVAIVIGLAFVVIGLIKLGGQNKGSGFTFLVVGGMLAAAPFFVQMTGETVSGKELSNDALEVIGASKN